MSSPVMITNQALNEMHSKAVHDRVAGGNNSPNLPPAYPQVQPVVNNGCCCGRLCTWLKDPTVIKWTKIIAIVLIAATCMTVAPYIFALITIPFIPTIFTIASSLLISIGAGKAIQNVWNNQPIFG